MTKLEETGGKYSRINWHFDC